MEISLLNNQKRKMYRKLVWKSRTEYYYWIQNTAYGIEWILNAASWRQRPSDWNLMWGPKLESITAEEYTKQFLELTKVWD